MSSLPPSVSENELERGRIEYKRELGNGHKTLEAIAAMANTFGGVVLVGIDEDQEAGPARIVGVDPKDRDRLSRMCWDQLVPPFTPDIIPVKLDGGDEYILVVVVDPDYARRPVMVTQGNKIPVRIEGHNVQADWYRLRELFAEQPVSSFSTSLPSLDDSILKPKDADTDLAIRGRLLLTGPRVHSHQITEPARLAALAAPNSDDSPITGGSSSLRDFMNRACPDGWEYREWELDGPASGHEINARWQGFQPGMVARIHPEPRRLAEADLHIELATDEYRKDVLLIELEVLLASPVRPHVLTAYERWDNLPKEEYKLEAEPGRPTRPFIGLGTLRRLLLDITGTLWGAPGEALSTGIFSQPLGPPAELDMVLFTVPLSSGHTIYGRPALNAPIDFGTATLVPGNTPKTYILLGPVQPDRSFASPAEQIELVDSWLIQLGIENGYQNMEQEVARWTGLTR